MGTWQRNRKMEKRARELWEYMKESFIKVDNGI